jgi:hypothetical protein
LVHERARAARNHADHARARSSRVMENHARSRSPPARPRDIPLNTLPEPLWDRPRAWPRPLAGHNNEVVWVDLPVWSEFPECENLRLEIRELWRRVRALEDLDMTVGEVCQRLRKVENIAMTAERRYRISRHARGDRPGVECVGRRRCVLPVCHPSDPSGIQGAAML